MEERPWLLLVAVCRASRRPVRTEHAILARVPDASAGTPWNKPFEGFDIKVRQVGGCRRVTSTPRTPRSPSFQALPSTGFSSFECEGS